MRVLRATLVLGLFAAAGYMAWVYGTRHSSAREAARKADAEQERRSAEFLKAYGGKDVRIVQFYAADGYVIEGDSASICYTVVNAKSVKMDPPLAGVGVAFNRCVEDHPEKTTRYTLTVEGFDGSVVLESFIIQAKADPQLLPLIRKFEILRSYDDPVRRVYWLSFETRNAAVVSIDPPAFPPVHGAPYGRFYVAPVATTTYTLTAVDKKGRSVQQKLTVEVSPKG